MCTRTWFLIKQGRLGIACLFSGQKLLPSAKQSETLMYSLLCCCSCKCWNCWAGGCADAQCLSPTFFPSKGRNFIKPLGRITLEWLLLICPCWFVALRPCSFRTQKLVFALMGWCWLLELLSCWLCSLNGSRGGCAC